MCRGMPTSAAARSAGFASAYIPTIGGTVELTATLWDKNGNEVNAPITFMSEDPSIAEVNVVDGKAVVTGLKKGGTSIYAYGAGLSAQSYISVGSNAETSASLVKIIPGMDSISMKRNQTTDLIIATVPANWTFTNLAVASSNSSVATAQIVLGKLRISALNEGTAVITVSEGSISGRE